MDFEGICLQAVLSNLANLRLSNNFAVSCIARRRGGKFTFNSFENRLHLQIGI